MAGGFGKDSASRLRGSIWRSKSVWLLGHVPPASFSASGRLHRIRVARPQGDPSGIPAPPSDTAWPQPTEGRWQVAHYRQSCLVQDGERGARNRVISIGLKVGRAAPVEALRTGFFSWSHQDGDEGEGGDTDRAGDL